MKLDARKPAIIIKGSSNIENIVPDFPYVSRYAHNALPKERIGVRYKMINFDAVFMDPVISGP